MLSILAGILIGTAGAIYLSIGGPIGAFLFSIGLLTILIFELELFTGKADLLTNRKISKIQLLKIWLGNFFGTIIAALFTLLLPTNFELVERAQEITNLRLENGFITNFGCGIFCGILMYAAVDGFRESHGNLLYAILPVAAFILMGANHCVADMYYCHLSAEDISVYTTLIPTTLGNFFGCNLIPWYLAEDEWDKKYR